MRTFNGEVDIYNASAGTAKTTTLLDIIDKHLEQGVPIDKIAFLTFTKKGAEVAQMRTAERFNLPLNQLVHFRTIHSLAFRGVRATRQKMMDLDKYKEFGDKAGFDFGNLSLNTNEGIDWKEFQDRQLVTLEQIYRNNPKYCEMIMEDRVDYGRFSEYLRLYVQYKRTFGYVDFTDLLEDYINDGRSEDVDIVCLDEMQDSTPLQWRLLFQAFSNASHIYIAADSKQGVFQWSGSDITVPLRLKGNQHYLDISYRVPSRILDFADNIVREMSFKDGSHCKAYKEGGEVIELGDIEELTEEFDMSKSYFFLARNRKFFKYYIDWCRENGVPYCICGEPVFTNTDKQEFRDGKVQHWDRDKLAFAQDCYRNNTFYPYPNINISTIHTVKGDEADVVVLMSDISKLVATHFDVDEDVEHRVFYVGVTRAKEKLYVIQPTTRLYYPYLIQ